MAAAKAFCAYVSEDTGIEFVPVVCKTYTQGVSDLTEGRVDLAWLSPISVVTAEGTRKARVLLKAVRRDEPFYWGAVIVKKGSGIESLKAGEGEERRWTDPSSTAGHLMTKAALIRAGIRPETDFVSNQFLGAHDRLVKAVLDGVVQAGATFANDPEKKVGAWTVYLPPEEASQIVPIFFTEPIPGDAVAAGVAFADGKKETLDLTTACLVRMGEDEKGKALLGGSTTSTGSLSRRARTTIGPPRRGSLERRAREGVDASALALTGPTRSSATPPFH